MYMLFICSPLSTLPSLNTRMHAVSTQQNGTHHRYWQHLSICYEELRAYAKNRAHFGRSICLLLTAECACRMYCFRNEHDTHTQSVRNRFPITAARSDLAVICSCYCPAPSNLQRLNVNPLCLPDKPNINISFIKVNKLTHIIIIIINFITIVLKVSVKYATGETRVLRRSE